MVDFRVRCQVRNESVIRDGCGLRSASPVSTEIHDSGVARVPFSDGKNGHFSKVPGLHCRYILLARVTGLYFINVYITSLSEISDARKWVAE